MTTSHLSLAAVPDGLLVPLLEEAADTLRAMESVDVPSSLRHVHGFDRRGLLAGPGRRQLIRALDHDDGFRARVLERFCARGDVNAVVVSWTPTDAVKIVEAAAARRDLPLLASSLWAAMPDASEFGLGLIAARNDEARREREDADARGARDREVAELEEARRRSEAARHASEEEVARLTEQLQKERASRREHDEQVRTGLLSDAEDLEALRAQHDALAAALDEERLRSEREVKRARALEEDLRELRATREREREAAAADAAAVDARAIAEAAAAAERVAGSLRALERRARQSSPRTPERAPSAEPARTPAPTKRAEPAIPAGMVADSRAGIEAMLRTDDVMLVVDGYNVTKRAWPDASAADQRERLGIAVTAMNRSLGCRVLIVFDGDGSGAARPPIRRGGVRVVFSDAGEEADEVVVREIAEMPKRIPVVVVSSDAWVRGHAEREGAVVVGADAFLKLARPDR